MFALIDDLLDRWYIVRRGWGYFWPTYWRYRASGMAATAADSQIEADIARYTAYLQDMMERALTEMVQTAGPIPYTDQGFRLVNTAAQRTIARTLPDNWESHVTQSYRFAIEAAMK